MIKNAYIHIPFCKSKCNYCSFISYVNLEQKEEYLEALIAQINAEYKGEKLNTLYFGGGTPSLISIDNFKSIISLFSLESDAEITVEVNPDSVNLDFLSELKNLGVNRLSIGAQTFDDSILTLIGRRHSSEQIKTAVNMAKQAGFNNISLDFIYGLPSQDIDGFENDLKMAIDLDIQHISLYGLKIEEGCYFYNNPPNHIPPDLDIQADMYLKAIEVAKKYGFEHYEISNFAKKQNVILNSFQDRIVVDACDSFVSKHNLNYWNNNTYYGFGCAASGYWDNIRYINQTGLENYIQNPLKKVFEQELSRQEILEEEIFLGFRKIAGINVAEINKKFDINFLNKYSNIIQKYSNFFVNTDNGYALTLDGLLVSNEILSEFISLDA